MRTVFLATCLTCSISIAWAQDHKVPDQKAPDKSEYSTGRTVTPDNKGQLQPQGWTGPLETGTGGAPAASPQGQSPPGMQAAPEGSSKSTVSPDKK
jgi:hypothetical protein